MCDVFPEYDSVDISALVSATPRNELDFHVRADVQQVTLFHIGVYRAHGLTNHDGQAKNKKTLNFLFSVEDNENRQIGKK